MTRVERSTYRLWPSVLLLIAGAAVLCAPLFAALDHYGWQDWDQFTFRHETARLAIMRDRQWPVWNPYSNGGTALIAHPHSPALSPWFLVTLALGAPLSLRVLVVVAIAAGASGMAALLRQAGASRVAGVLGGVVFMMSSHFVLHTTEGHFEWMGLAAMPWVAVLLQQSRGIDRRAVIGAALLFASIVSFGAVYISAIFAVFFSLWRACESMRQRTVAPLIAWGAVLALSAGVSAAKLLPTMDFVSRYPRVERATQTTTLGTLLPALLSPRQASLYLTQRAAMHRDDFDLATPPRFELGFQEYGAYLSLAGTGLALAGLFLTWRAHWPLYVAGALAGVMVLGDRSPIDIWAWLRTLPLYSQLSVPSRMLAGVVFAAAFSAGMALDASIRRWRLSVPWLTGAAWVLVGLTYGELLTQAHTLFREVFRIPPVHWAGNVSFVQHAPPAEVARVVPDPMHSLLYPRLAAGFGALDGYENLTVTRGTVHVVGTPEYRGEVFLRGTVGTASIGSWSMGRIAVHVTADQPATVHLNQNYDPGWSVIRRDSNGRVSKEPAMRSADGLISAPVSSGSTDLTFEYWPPGFTAGLWISGLALAGCAAAGRRR